MKVFVTGGNGFIGSRVVRALIERGHQVRCLLRTTSNAARINGLAWEPVIGDVRDLASLVRGMAGCDCVIHLASIVSWNDISSPEMRDVVLEGTRNVLEAGRRLGGLRVVFISSSTAINGSPEPRIFDESATFTLSDPSLVYSRYKREAEDLCRKAAAEGLPVVIVNPAEVYGPHDTALVTAGNLVDFVKSKPVLVCRGGTSVVHVDDVAEGIALATEKGRNGERYILGGDNLTVRELARLSLELSGKKAPIITVPNPLLRGAAHIASALKIPLPFNPHVIPYATRYWFVDSSKAKQELGATFRSARDTLAPTLTWLREAGYIS